MMYDASKGDLANHGWNNELLSSIGLDDLVSDDYSIIGREVLAPGQVNLSAALTSCCD